MEESRRRQIQRELTAGLEMIDEEGIEHLLTTTVGSDEEGADLFRVIVGD